MCIRIFKNFLTHKLNTAQDRYLAKTKCLRLFDKRQLETLPGRAFRPPRNSTPTASLSCDGGSRGRGVGLGVILGGGRAQGVRRSAAAETYVPGSGKYIAPDYLVKKVTAKELEELVRGERKVPLIVDFYATWCGPCVLMAQDIEMVDTDDEYELARDMQVRGLPTLYFFSPDQSKDALRTEGLIPIDMTRNIIDNEL
uniref:Thioredoxin-like protein CITRX, chloroplastic n=1 Tax=Oryza meridionalis TaxID=40149 RepID=A0A0E0EL25_9ORYZ